MVKNYFIFLALLISLSFVSSIYAQTLYINPLKDTYLPGETLVVNAILYEGDKKIEGSIEYKILDYFTDVFMSGTINSGGEARYVLPTEAPAGLWKIMVKSGEAEAESYFTVLEFEKVNVSLEKDNLVLTNTGNMPYEKSLSIIIGDHHETALVYLAISQTKKIHLAAPTGTYDIKVIDETSNNEFSFEGIGLTGNAVGIERLEGNFIKEYPLVILFLGSILLVVLVIIVLRLQDRYLHG